MVDVSPAAAELLERSPAAMIGRDLFREIAPALATPACLGRFLQGVRTGSLHDSFTVALGRENGSLELGLLLTNGPRPGIYRVEVVETEKREPSRQREAMLTVDLRARSEPVDPIVCEREPIHLPGSIQPPNGLLAADPTTLRITAASENIADTLGGGLNDILGRTLTDVLPEVVAAAVAGDMESGAIPHGAPERRDLILGDPPRPFAMLAHIHDGRLILEFEATPAEPRDFRSPSLAALRLGIAELRLQGSVAGHGKLAADMIREITGYERVLVYQFDDDWNGEAIAESIVPDWDESLLGLRFPASDIPRQARELYTRSPTRMVVDRDAAPVRLVSRGGENRPIDLTFTNSRSLSPIHLEYQRNLGVNGSMSMAILVGGRLWGLLIGHHRRPHYVPPEARDAVSVIVDALALLIRDREREAPIEARNATSQTATAMLGKIAGADDPVAALTEGATVLTDLFGATGAAVVLNGEITTVGEAPPREVLADLVPVLAPRIDVGALATDNAASLLPALAAHADVASGLLAAEIEPGGRDMLIWFRPEVVRTVTWGGDPNKPVVSDPRSAAILPRRSFERWVEVRRGHSPPWAVWTLEIAENLAHAVKGVALRNSRRVVELSAKNEALTTALEQKDSLIEQKDLLTREIDHRVKNSLQIISSFLAMQSRLVRDPDAKAAFDDTYARVMSIARVHNSLYQSETVTEVDLGQTIEALCADLAGVGGEKKDLELRVEHGLMVPYRKAVALCLIATELVTNAWKYAYPRVGGGPVEVAVGHHEGGGLRLRVSDQGEGLPADWDRRERQGLGMRLIRAMLSQIDATMDVESLGGTSFTVRF